MTTPFDAESFNEAFWDAFIASQTFHDEEEATPAELLQAYGGAVKSLETDLALAHVFGEDAAKVDELKKLLQHCGEVVADAKRGVNRFAPINIRPSRPVIVADPTPPTAEQVEELADFYRRFRRRAEGKLSQASTWEEREKLEAEIAESDRIIAGVAGYKRSKWARPKPPTPAAQKRLAQVCKRLGLEVETEGATIREAKLDAHALTVLKAKIAAKLLICLETGFDFHAELDGFLDAFADEERMGSVRDEIGDSVDPDEPKEIDLDAARKDLKWLDGRIKADGLQPFDPECFLEDDGEDDA